MGARQELAAALTLVLPATVVIVTDVRDLGELAPELSGVMQIIRTSIDNLGRKNQLQHFELWVVDPHTDPTLAEDSLDANLDDVLEAIDGLDWLLWDKVERGIHPGGKYEAYKITIQTKSHFTL